MKNGMMGMEARRGSVGVAGIAGVRGLRDVPRAWVFALALLSAGVFASIAWAGPVGKPAIDWTRIPLPECPQGRGGGDGHQPDPHTVFNQRAELAGGELYLLRGTVVIASKSPSASLTRKKQPYFHVDLGAHPWLASAIRKANPYYLIEGTTSYWRAYNGSYGELAVKARVQFVTDAEGEVSQVISLQVIPELSLISKKEK
jgi:hypothetical protein